MCCRLYVQALKNQQSELESSQDTLVGMVQNYRNRTRNALTKATTSEERISAQLEHLRRARETDIQLIYLAPDLAFPDDVSSIL